MDNMMKEIDVFALFGGLRAAGKRAQETGEDQTVRLSDYDKEDKKSEKK